MLPEDLVPKLAEWGYDGIEVWGGRPPKQGEQKWGLEGRTDLEVKRLKKLIDDQGLEVPAVSTYFRFTSGREDFEKSIQNGRRYCQIANLFGAQVIRVGLEDQFYLWPHRDDIPQKASDNVELLVRIIKDLGREVASVKEAREITGVELITKA